MLQSVKKLALSAAVIAASGAYVWSQAGSTDSLGQGLAGADLLTGSVSGQALASTSGTMAPQDAPFVTGGTAQDAAAPAAAAQPAAAPASTGALPPLPAANDSAANGSFAPSAATSDAAPVAPAPVAVADAQPPAAPVDPAPVPTTNTVNVPMPRLRPHYQQVAAAAPTPAPASAPRSSTRSLLTRIAATTSSLADGTYRGPVVDAYYGLMQIEAVVQNGRLVTIHVLQYPNDRRTSIYINRQALPMLRDEVIQAQSASVDIVSGATLSSRAFIQSLGAALNKAHA